MKKVLRAPLQTQMKIFDHNFSITKMIRSALTVEMSSCSFESKIVAKRNNDVKSSVLIKFMFCFRISFARCPINFVSVTFEKTC